MFALNSQNKLAIEKIVPLVSRAIDEKKLLRCEKKRTASKVGGAHKEVCAHKESAQNMPTRKCAHKREGAHRRVLHREKAEKQNMKSPVETGLLLERPF
jgi:hypothetical protein